MSQNPSQETCHLDIVRRTLPVLWFLSRLLLRVLTICTTSLITSLIVSYHKTIIFRRRNHSRNKRGTLSMLIANLINPNSITRARSKKRRKFLVRSPRKVKWCFLQIKRAYSPRGYCTIRRSISMGTQVPKQVLLIQERNTPGSILPISSTVLKICMIFIDLTTSC